MNKLLYTSVALLSASALLFTGCKKDDDTPKRQSPPYQSVVYFVNEGDFFAGNGNIGYFDGRDAGNIIQEEDLFFKVNNRHLGDVVQSLSFHNGKGYIVVNNSQKIEVVEENSFASVATIQMGGPRYIQGVSASKAYVTDWETNSVKVLDLNSNSAVGSVAVGPSPERMLLSDNRLYVSYAYSADSIITLINTTTDQKEADITVAPMPNAMQQDKNGKLWVICGGVYDDFNTPADESVAGALVRVNMQQNQKELQLAMPNSTDHPNLLAVSPGGDYVYYNLFDKIYRMDVNAATLPATPFVELPGVYIYGLNVNPANGDLLVMEAPFTANGTMHVFSSTGQAKVTIPTGKFTNDAIVR